MREQVGRPAFEAERRPGGIERVGDAEVVRLRGTLLPLVRIADVLGIERTYYDEETGCSRGDRRRNIADRRSRTSPLFEPADPASREPIRSHRYSSFRQPS